MLCESVTTITALGGALGRALRHYRYVLIPNTENPGTGSGWQAIALETCLSSLD
jgi:hypothetical protein